MYYFINKIEIILSLVCKLCFKGQYTLHHILQEMKKFYEEIVADAKTIGRYFNKTAGGTMEDLVKRKETCQKRAYRIPYSVLSSY